jgi:penicillin G amidase
MRRRTSIAAVLVGLIVALTPVAAASEHHDAVIVRDSWGVPHVRATSTEALFRGMGRAAAEDRLWQAELLRRSATGRLAELFGPSNVAADVQARTLFGPAERRAELFASASPAMQEILTAYAAGMNEIIDGATGFGDLPPEFGAFGLMPESWTVDHSVAIFLALGAQFGWSGANELANAQTWAALVARFGPQDAATIFSDLFWLDDPDAPTTVPADDAVGQKGRRASGPPGELPPSAAAAGAQLAARQAAAESAWENAGMPTGGPASNALVISSRLSASGAPLLLGGPQMGYSAPQINHEVGLHGAGLDVTGMTIAGIPVVAIGVGNGYAWTLTSGGSDNSDIYAETLNPDNPTQYLFDGDWVDMDCVAKTIGVAGAAPVTVPVCRTVHGPVVAVVGPTAYTLRNATYGSEMASLEAWIGLGGVNNIAGFASGLPAVAYNFNVLYADRTGNIAYWHVGHIPIRPEGTNPFFPLDGTGGQEWTGIVAWAEMPHSRNPGQGWLASWNNKPMAGWKNSSADFWLWGGAHRVNTFILQAQDIGRRSATIGTLEDINRIGGWTTDTPTGQAGSVFVTSYLDRLLDAVDTSADPRLPAVVAELAGWDRLQVDLDGDGFYDRPWGTVFNAWWFSLARGVFDEVWDLSNRFVVGNLIDRMLRGDDAGLPLAYDYLEGATMEEAVTAALISALDDLAAQHGSDDPADWRQPISVIRWTPQGAGAVPDTIWMNRGTYNQLVHLRGRVEAWNVVSPGQSGSPFSPHFADQLSLYAGWEYKPMLLQMADVRRDR